jgi:hypothetical protein
VYQQDYLDLFIDGKTEPTYNRLATIDGVFGVPIEKFDTTINMCNTYTDLLTDDRTKITKLCLLVDYNFPFDNELKGKLDKNATDYDDKINRCIKFILIGEAPPPYTAPLKENTYFYNKDHIGNTPYFTAPCKAFDALGNKGKKLVQLADKGALLLDLFPFAIPYNDPIKISIKNLAVDQFKKIVSRLNIGGDLNGCVVDCEDCEDCLKFSFLCSAGENGHAEYIINNVNFGHGVGIVEIGTCTIPINELSNDPPSLTRWDHWAIHRLTAPIPSLINLPFGNWHGITENARIIGSKGTLNKTKIIGVKKPKGMINKYKSIGKIMFKGTPHEIPIRFGFNL